MAADVERSLNPHLTRIQSSANRHLGAGDFFLRAKRERTGVGREANTGSMRVAYLIAGAGGVYCGSCMRDNRLAATLIEQGRDVVLMPLYTPIRTDEHDVSQRRVHYGGINAYLQQKSAFFQHTPKALDRLLDAPALLRGVGRFAANTRAEDLGQMTVSVLRGPDGAQRKELDKLIATLRELRPSLVNLPNLMFVGTAGAVKAALRIPVVCTLAGEDIFLDALPQPHRDEAFALVVSGAADIDRFVAPTRYYATHALRHFDLPRDRVSYVPMGVRAGDFESPPTPTSKPFTIGYLARICPEKGLAALCDAFIRLRSAGTNCRLRVAGYLGGADRAYYEKARRRIAERGCDDAFEYVGEVDRTRKLAFLGSLHAVCVPAEYHEAKGFYVLEAMAAGVPVVLPRRGSFPELIEATGGGLLYDSDGGEGLDRSLRRLIDDETLRRRLGDAGRRAVRESFTDRVMADETWAIYQEVCASCPS